MCLQFCHHQQVLNPDENYIKLHEQYLERCIMAAINANLAEENENTDSFVKYSDEFILNSMYLMENIKNLPYLDINKIEKNMNIKISATTTGLKSSEYHWKLYTE